MAAATLFAANALLAISTAHAQADGADVFLDDSIGVTILPPGVQGGPNEINHVPDGGDGVSQALTIDFGGDVYGVSAVIGAFLVSEGGANCAEVGRWTAFDESGAQVGTGTFVAESNSADEDVLVSTSPLRFLVLNAEPYANGCTSASSIPDSSDYSVVSIDYSATDGGPPLTITGNALGDLSPDDFLAYDTNEPFQDGDGNLIGPDGIKLGTIIVEPDKCEGGTGTGSGETCEIKYDDRITSTIANAADVSGTVEIVDIVTIEDQRLGCEGTGFTTEGEPVPNGDLELEGYPAAPDGSPLTIPAHLCGIPSLDGTPQFKLLVLNSTIRVSESIISHLVQQPDNPAFDCRDPADIAAGIDRLPEPDVAADPDTLRSQQPVIGWLPRQTEKGDDVFLLDEIPVVKNGAIVTTLEDITTGPCGSYRGKSFSFSYIAYDLRHAPGTGFDDYVSLIRGEIDQLADTFSQAGVCYDKFSLAFNDQKLIEGLQTDLDRERYSFAKSRLLKYREKLLGNNGAIDTPFENCFFNLSTEDSGEVLFITPDEAADLPYLTPRNFGGDVLVQVDHILYMFEWMLGVLDPPIPAE